MLGVDGWLQLLTLCFQIATLQESYKTPLEHTPGNPLANYERNPFVACWVKFRGVLQRCVETTLDTPHKFNIFAKNGCLEDDPFLFKW